MSTVALYREPARVRPDGASEFSHVRGPGAAMLAVLERWQGGAGTHQRTDPAMII
jgi:hypothetical protein